MLRLSLLFDQLHLSNINKKELLTVLSEKQYQHLIDIILDEIIEHQREMGLRN